MTATIRERRCVFTRAEPIKITPRNLAFLATLVRMTDAARGGFKCLTYVSLLLSMFHTFLVR